MKKKRFHRNKLIREYDSKEQVDFDPMFLNMLRNTGLPNCSGIAIGLDRLFMIFSRNNNINTLE